MKNKMFILDGKAHFLQIFSHKDFQFVPVLVVLGVIVLIILKFHMPTEQELGNDEYYFRTAYEGIYDFIYEKEETYWESKGYDVSTYSGIPDENNEINISWDSDYKFNNLMKYKRNGVYELLGHYRISSNTSESIHNYFYATVTMSPKRTLFLYVDLNLGKPNINYITEDEFYNIKDLFREEEYRQRNEKLESDKEKFNKEAENYYRENNINN